MDTGEALLDRGQTGRLVVAVILMDTNGDLGMGLDHGLDHAADHQITGIGSSAAARLQDDRRVRFLGRPHDADELFHVVDVECG